ncbi:MAG: DUF86 domain-containing protein [Candidatus Omnitrophica bacterium]|nr:DUF86 domain-containing protein [Candidatus Omnitrophota bacterium]MCM8829802.1 DUF86 domain-containing protein [Candidatus Omnitrophota bacterium]
MKRDYKLFVKDIIEAITKIESFVGEMAFEKFMKDEKTKSAVIREIEVIGEATKNIPEAIRRKCKELPWKEMARMRDKIIHFYFGIDYEIVWDVLKHRLPQIKPVISKLLKKLEEENG